VDKRWQGGKGGHTGRAEHTVRVSDLEDGLLGRDLLRSHLGLPARAEVFPLLMSLWSLGIDGGHWALSGEHEDKLFSDS
jgi:hypothetical protein